MRLSQLSFVSLAALAAACTACRSMDLPTSSDSPPGGPSLVVSDGANNGGNEHFYFLPPLVAAPSPTGIFDGGQSPEVKICHFTGGACGAEVAAFSTTTGSGDDLLKVVPEDEHYIVSWHTDLSGLVTGETYRIRVLVGSQVLGYADVVPLAGSQMKNANTLEEIALKDGSTLPIKFRIEEGAIITTVPDPVPTVGAEDWDHVATATGSTCALTETGAAYCWGSNYFGKLGLGYYSSDMFDQPQAVVGGHSFASITGGSAHMCALKADGSAWCWGSNEKGTLGRGTMTYSEPSPGPVSGGHVFASLSASLYNTCGRTVQGYIYCWGWSNNGMQGSAGSSSVPVKLVVPGDPTFTRLSISTSHACALATTGEVWCWGNNDKGQLGQGFTGGTFTVPVVAVGGMQFTGLGLSHRTTCGLTASGEAHCWGANDDGQLGRGFATISPGLTALPVLGGHSFVRISGGERSFCALKATGEAYCWGDNEWAQLGVGFMSSNEATPTPVAGDYRFGSLDLSITHSCAINGNGLIRCWGQNINYQLGNPDPSTALEPVAVPSPLTFMTF